MTVGMRLKERRRALNISQEELGEIIGVHANTIRKWEHGERSPDVKRLGTLAQALQTTVAYLSCETDNPSRSKGAVPVASVTETIQGNPPEHATETLEEFYKPGAPGRLVYTWGGSSHHHPNRIDVPDTPSNQAWFRILMAEVIAGRVDPAVMESIPAAG